MDRIRITLGDLQAKLAAEEDVSFSLQRGISSQQTTIATCERDIAELNSKLASLRQRNKFLSSDFHAVENRHESLSNDMKAMNNKHDEVYASLANSIDELKHLITLAERSDNRSNLRLNAMAKYTDLVLQMNGDLCETLTMTAKAKERILKLADKFAPPRYSWPKKTTASYPGVEDVAELVEDAAVASALEQRAASAAKIAHNRKSKIKKYYDDMSDSQSEASSDILDSTVRRRSTASVQGLKSSSYRQRSRSADISSSRRRAKSPAERLEQRAAEVIAAVTSTSPLRYSSPTRHESDSFIPSSQKGDSKVFNIVAKDRKLNRDNIHKFAAFSSK